MLRSVVRGMWQDRRRTGEGMAENVLRVDNVGELTVLCKIRCQEEIN
jgi:hypothetical protein